MDVRLDREFRKPGIEATGPRPGKGALETEMETAPSRKLIL